MYNTAILLVSSFVALGISQDPCTVNQLINEPKRSPSYVPGIGEALICDRGLADGWYRFSDNGMMPEKCIDRYHCGTHDPIWFMGKHPNKQGQEATGKACANTGFGANCCGYEVGTITVKHCGSFFVYRLSRVQGCSFAYCSGKGDPCPFGTSSPTGYQPGCTASFPTMAGNPILSGPFTSGFCPDGKRYTDFYFTCRVNYSNPLDANVAFEIKWLIDRKPINVTTNIFGFDREASIHVNQLQNKMGHELSCSASSYYLSSPRVRSPLYASTDHYRMEIKYDPGLLELDEKARTPTEIKVVSTIPIPCIDCDVLNNCVYSLHLHAKNLTSECNITLSYKDWDDTRKSAVATTYLEADKDFVNSNKTGYLQPVPYISSEVNPLLYASYTPPPLQVGIKNSPAPVCICSGDPHCLTFDRNNAGMADKDWTKGYYDMYHVGIFTMVQTKAVHPNIPEFKVEIQTQTCWNVACICGVVAREGTDVVSINTCDFRLGGNRIDEEILFPDKFSGLTIIQAATKSYVIYFPSGRWVKVYKSSTDTITNVEVQVRPDDANNVEGLCGQFSGKTEELGTETNGNPIPYTKEPNTFIEANRVQFGSSMYEQNDITYTTPANHTRLCDCIQDTKGWHVDCKPNKGLLMQIGTHAARLPNYTDITPHVLNRSKSFGKRNATSSHYSLSQYSKNVAFVPVKQTWPTKDGLYEVDVRRICQDAINNLDTLRTCKLEANINFGGIIDTCVEDVKITGDITLARGVIHAAMSMCVETVVKNPSLFHPGKSPNWKIRPCPGDCTGHGVCTQGNCICNFGFDGTDCSVDTTKPPVIVRIDRLNPCDAMQDPCAPIYMTVSNYYKSPDSKCHLRELKFSNGTFVETGYGFYTIPEDISSTGVFCLIPSKSDVQGKSLVAYAVSITSDGTMYSQSKTFTIYNSTCMTCDANSVCAIKPQTCMIDGSCWTENETKPGDQTYMCDPHAINTEWTHRGADIWTRKQTGCICTFDTSQADCACCEEGAVQCPFGTHHQCVQSGSLSNCGTLMPAPMFGIDGYTKSFTGCSCDHDRTQNDCACCQNGGVQCGSHFRNQCVMNGHIDQCGQKQHIFGP